MASGSSESADDLLHASGHEGSSIAASSASTRDASGSFDSSRLPVQAGTTTPSHIASSSATDESRYCHAIEAIILQLDDVARDRIRDARAAKVLLSALIKAIRSTASADMIPTCRTLQRLCYYANARDSSIRSSTFRAIRYLLVDPAAVRALCESRLVISLVRSLERDQKFLWERVQAIKIVHIMMEKAPECFPFAILRSLIAIAQHTATEQKSSDSNSARGMSPDRRPQEAGAAVLRMAQEEEGGPRAYGTGGPSADNLRKVAVDTLRSAILIPALAPALRVCNVDYVLAQCMVEYAGVPGSSVLVKSIIVAMLCAISTQLGTVRADVVVRLLLSEFSNGITDTKFSSDTKSRIGICKYLLVSILRSIGGFFLCANDRSIFTSLFSAITQARHPALVLQCMGLILELLSFPDTAIENSLPELAGHAYTVKGATDGPLLSASCLIDPALAQAIALSYVTMHSASPDNAPAVQETLGVELDAGPISFVESIPDLSSMHEAGSRSLKPASGVAQTREPASQKVGVKAPASLAVLHQQLERSAFGEPELSASLWMRVAQAAEFAHNCGHASSRKSANRSGCTNSFLNFFRTQYLVALLEGGLLRVLTSAVLHDHPLVRLAAKSLSRFICVASVNLLPKSFAHPVLNAPDLFQLAAACAARSPLPVPSCEEIVASSRLPNHSESLRSLLLSYACVLSSTEEGFSVSHPLHAEPYLGLPLAVSTASSVRSTLLRSTMVLSAQGILQRKASLLPVLVQMPARADQLGVCRAGENAGPLSVDLKQPRGGQHDRQSVAVFQSLIEVPEMMPESAMMQCAILASTTVPTLTDEYAPAFQETDLDEKRASVVLGKIGRVSSDKSNDVLMELANSKYSTLQPSSYAQEYHSSTPVDRAGITRKDQSRNARAALMQRSTAPVAQFPDQGGCYNVGSGASAYDATFPGATVGAAALNNRLIVPLTSLSRQTWHRWSTAKQLLADSSNYRGVVVATNFDAGLAAATALHRAWDAIRASTVHLVDTRGSATLMRAELGIWDVLGRMQEGQRDADEGSVKVLGLTSARLPKSTRIEGFRSGFLTASHLLANITDYMHPIADTSDPRYHALLESYSSAAKLLHVGSTHSVVHSWTIIDAVDIAQTYVPLTSFSEHIPESFVPSEPLVPPPMRPAASEELQQPSVHSKTSSDVAKRIKSFLSAATSHSTSTASNAVNEELRSLGRGIKRLSGVRRGIHQSIGIADTKAAQTQSEEQTHTAALIAEASTVPPLSRAASTKMALATTVESSELPKSIVLTEREIALRRRQVSTIQFGYLSHVREDERFLDWAEHVTEKRLKNGLANEIRNWTARLNMSHQALLASFGIQQIFRGISCLPTHRLWKLQDGEFVVPPSIQQQLWKYGEDLGTDHSVDALNTASNSNDDHSNLLDARPQQGIRAGFRDEFAASIRAHLLQGPPAGASNASAASVAKQLREKESFLHHLNAALSSIRVSKVTTTKDWRVWDWGAVTLLLDHHLVNHQIFSEIITKTSFFQRVGDFFTQLHAVPPDGVAAYGNFTQLPWMPSTLRFLRVGKQWLSLALADPIGRDQIWRRPAKASPTEDYGHGFFAYILVAFWCYLSKTFKRLVRSNVNAASKPQQGLAAAAARFFSVQGRNKSGGLILSERETAAARLITELIGAQYSGEPIASMFTRPTFFTTMAREAIVLFSYGLSFPWVRSTLSMIRFECVFGLPDAPAHTKVVTDLYARVKELFGDEMMSLLLPEDDILLTLVHLPLAEQHEYLAEALLTSLDFSAPGIGTTLLLCWIASHRVKSAVTSEDAGQLKSTFSPPSKLPVSTADEERGPEVLIASRRFLLFCVAFLRILLRRAIPGFSQWGMQLLTKLMVNDVDQVARLACSIVTEAVLTSQVFRMSFILHHPREITKLNREWCRVLFVELAAEPLGFHLLHESGVLQWMSDSWLQSGYVLHYLEECLVANSHFLVREPLDTDTAPEKSTARPDAFPTTLLGWKDIAPSCRVNKNNYSSQAWTHYQSHCNPSPGETAVDTHADCQAGCLMPEPMPLPFRSRICSLPEEVDPYYVDLCAAEPAFASDIDAFTRLPWRVEVWAEWERQQVVGPRSTRPDNAQRQCMKVEIPCDISPDLSCLLPDAALSNGGRQGPMCDGYLTATCIDAQGSPQSIALPSGATVKAALFCGTHPVSQFGDIPSTAWESLSTMSHRAAAGDEVDEPGNIGSDIGIYDGPQEAIGAILKRMGQTPYGKRIPTANAGSAASSASVSQRDGDGEEDDPESERSSTSKQADKRLTTDFRRGATSPVPPSQIDGHDAIEETSLRLRKRNAVAVTSLSLPVSHRHALGWMHDAGVVQLDGCGGFRARTGSFTDIKHITGDPTSSYAVGTSKLPDFLLGGPDANTVVYNTATAASHVVSQAGAALRAKFAKHATWYSCTPSKFQYGILQQRGGSNVMAPDSDKSFCICPPGSIARFHFQVDDTDPDARVWHLQKIDFGVAFVPKRRSKVPAIRNLYGQLSQHDQGCAYLRSTGYVVALLDVAFDISEAKSPSQVRTDGDNMERKAALACLGSIAAHAAGYALVCSLLPDFPVRLDAAARGVELSKRFKVLPGGATCIWYDASQDEGDASIRMTAMFALHCIMGHQKGWEELTSLGWSRDREGVQSFTVPQVPSTAYLMADWQLQNRIGDEVDDSLQSSGLMSAANLPAILEEWRPVLMRVSELCSRVTQKDARAALLRLRMQLPDLFANAALYLHINVLLSRYNVVLPVRRFIHSLFDRVSFADAAW